MHIWLRATTRATMIHYDWEKKGGWGRGGGGSAYLLSMEILKKSTYASREN